MIRVPNVRLIDEEGVQVGIVASFEARMRARDVGLDLVEVAPGARPPVCKIMDYNKHKYQQTIRQKEARKRQTRIEVKELKFRPGTEQHDYDVKMKSMRRFLSAGNKVKCTIRFRGREMAHRELGLMVLDRVKTELGESVRIESQPKMEGRQMMMVVAPSGKIKNQNQ